jgi:hypothetical protein
MRVIEIKKHVTNGFRLGHLILDDYYSNDDVEYEVEDWCHKDGSGHSRGWRSEWREITDVTERGVIMMEEHRKLGKSIERIEKRRKDILDNLIVPFVEIHRK